MLPSQLEEDVLIAKLDVIKDVRSKTMQLEKIKAKILQQLQSIKTEDEHLSGYRAEMDNLKRERLMHIEALRVIEKDLTTIESTILEAEQEREHIRERAYHLLQEYNPLKQEIDVQRVQIGLEKLSEIPNNEQICKSSFPSCTGSQRFMQTPDRPRNAVTLSPNSPPSFISMSYQSRHQGGRIRRQQPPPMKTCSSCQELIHRNAPVCPMCKTKSTSKVCKKPKKNDNVD